MRGGGQGTAKGPGKGQRAPAAHPPSDSGQPQRPLAGVPSAERRAQWPEDARVYVQQLEQKIAELVVMQSMTPSPASLPCSPSDAPVPPNPSSRANPASSSPAPAALSRGGPPAVAPESPELPPAPTPAPAPPAPSGVRPEPATAAGDVEGLDGLLKQLMQLQTLFQATSGSAESISSLNLTAERRHSPSLVAGENVSQNASGAPASGQSYVTLDLRGHRFQLRREDVTKYPESHIGKVFGGKFKVPLKDGATVIDRDPTFFPVIVAYLEGRPVDFPNSKESLVLLEKEVRYYGLAGLLQAVQERIAAG